MIRGKSDQRPRPITIMEIIEINDDKLVIKNKKGFLLEYEAEKFNIPIRFKD